MTTPTSRLWSSEGSSTSPLSTTFVLLPKKTSPVWRLNQSVAITLLPMKYSKVTKLALLGLACPWDESRRLTLMRNCWCHSVSVLVKACCSVCVRYPNYSAVKKVLQGVISTAEKTIRGLLPSRNNRTHPILEITCWTAANAAELLKQGQTGKIKNIKKTWTGWMNVVGMTQEHGY